MEVLQGHCQGEAALSSDLVLLGRQLIGMKSLMVCRKSKARSCLTTLALHVACTCLLGRLMVLPICVLSLFTLAKSILFNGINAYFTRDTVSATGKIICNLCAVGVKLSFSSRVRGLWSIVWSINLNCQLSFCPLSFCPSSFFPSSFFPSSFCPSSFCPSSFCPSSFCPSSFCPSSFCPSSFCPSSFCPSSFCPLSFCPSSFCPSSFCPSSFCPSSFCPSSSCPSFLLDDEELDRSGGG